MFLAFLIFIFISSLLLWVWGWVSWGWTVSPLGMVLREETFDFLFEDISVVSLVMLFFCGSIALFYCYHYFGGESDSSLLFPLMVWFLSVMCVLVVSGNPLFSLVFWEYLGLVSFFLILFYSNSSSLRASLITLFASRFGDVALFFLVMWMSCWLSFSCFCVVLLLLLVVLSKSACYPFVSWLLEAMRAPTPVSSLVHSSTLVAAGIWFFFRYANLFGDLALCLLFGFSVVTVLVSGACALFFNDLKKLVALSTCNNVSWCLVFFICGDLDLALLQLLTHGVCKCYLFMTVGDLMSLSGGSQSAVGVYLSRYGGVLGVYLLSFLILSLCGMPFLGVFFSKHGLFSEITYIFGWGFLLFLSLGFFLSYSYSFRFVLLLLKGMGGLSSGFSSCFVIVSLISVLGTLINFSGSGVLSESVSLSGGWSALLLFIQMIGCFFGWLVFIFNEGGFLFGWSTLLYSDSVVKAVYSLYLSWSAVSWFSVYRWELYLMELFPRMGQSFLLFRPSLFSFNVLVFSVCFVVFFFFCVSL
uniref:NADH:ubiquinone reductase (H(+)-translocating) n=1 Tax=Scaphanocephalus sp. TaxID=3050632 RepID=A0AAU7YR52_9TREM